MLSSQEDTAGCPGDGCQDATVTPSDWMKKSSTAFLPLAACRVSEEIVYTHSQCEKAAATVKDVGCGRSIVSGGCCSTLAAFRHFCSAAKKESGEKALDAFVMAVRAALRTTPLWSTARRNAVDMTRSRKGSWALVPCLHISPHTSSAATFT